jgi:SAM-dependent methyltransferase
MPPGERESSAREPAVDDCGFPQEAYGPLADAEGGNFWFRSRNRLIVWALERYFPGATSMLEVGCGTGVVLEAVAHRFPEMHLVGVDRSSEALRIARDRVSAQLVRSDAKDLAFDGEFDVVGAFDVLEHIDDDRAVLRRLATAVRPGGGCLITVPQYQWLWSAADDYGRHRRRYTRRQIDGRTSDAGLRVLRSTAWVCTLLPIVAFSRFCDRRAVTFDPCRELRVSGKLNAALEFVLDVEVRAIRAGMTLPYGSSRLVVARKA